MSQTDTSTQHTAKQLFSDTVIYALANILQRGMMLILLPIYARYLTKSEFGAVDLIYQSIIIVILISSVGLPQSLPRGFYKENTTEEDNKKLLGVLTVFIVPIAIITFVAIYYFSDLIALLIFNGQGEGSWVELGGLLFLAMLLHQFALQILKAKRLAKQYSVWFIVTFILVAANNVYFIVYENMGLSGMLISNIIGFGIIGLILTVQLSRQIILNFEWHRLDPLFAFGIPMLPALLFRKIIDVSNRYFIPQLHTLDTLGDYVMGIKVANIVEIAVLTPFLYAWQPFFYATAKNENAKVIFAKIAFYFYLILSTVLLIVIIITPKLLEILGNGEYAQSESMVVILVISALLNGVQYSISPGIHLKNKLVKEAGCMFFAALFNVIFNILLIPIYGGVGAAYATLIAYAVYLLITFLLANKFYPVSYPYGYVFKTTILTAVCAVLLYQTDNMVYKVGIFCAYLLLGPLTDLLLRGELKLLSNFVRNRKRKI